MTPAYATLVDLARELRPAMTMVLGSGLKDGPPGFTERAAVSFADVPGLTAPSVAGHAGRLVLGTLDAVPLLLFQGRLHSYEGHPVDRVVRPIRVAADLGVREVVLTNAAGGLRSDLVPGQLMLLTDHFLWAGPNPWRNPGPGSRPSPYSESLRHRVRAAAVRLGENTTEGIYACLTGPCYETPAEIRALAHCGADAVGMSTAREADEAARLGLTVAAISLITNKAAGLGDGPLDHQEVLVEAAAAGDRLLRLLGETAKAAW